MAQSGTVCCWAIRLWYSRMTCAYSALAYSAPRRSIRTDDVGRSLWVRVPGGDPRVILRERRAGQRVTRLFFRGKGYRQGAPVRRRRSAASDAFPQASVRRYSPGRERGINPVAGQGRHQAGQRGFVLRFTIEDLRVHQQLVPACPAAGRHRRASAGAQRSPAPPPGDALR